MEFWYKHLHRYEYTIMYSNIGILDYNENYF